MVYYLIIHWISTYYYFYTLSKESEVGRNVCNTMLKIVVQNIVKINCHPTYLAEYYLSNHSTNNTGLKDIWYRKN